MSPPSDRSDDRGLQLILHPDRDTYSVAESIRPRLEILNRSDGPVEIGGGFEFSWDRVDFLLPNAGHLIGPNGLDLMLPFHREAPSAGETDPIRVAAHSSEWLYLPISNFLHLRQFGEYTFWLELIDSAGELHRSNRITFRLDDVGSSLPLDAVQLTLETPRSVSASTGPVVVTAVFTNRYARPLVFLKPQEDSFDGWVNPIYQFTVHASDGRGLALARRSGSMPTPVYDDDATFTVRPGHSSALELPLPDFPEMRPGDAYRVRLTYLVRDEAVGKGGDVLDQPMGWDDDVFRGRIESDERVIEIA